MGTDTSTHPFFVENGDSRRETAVLLTGTADEFGIDQHDIQSTSGGFNITERLAKAVYGDDFDPGDSDEDGDLLDAHEDGDPDLAESLRGRPQGATVSDEHLEAIGHDVEAEDAKGQPGSTEEQDPDDVEQDPDERETVHEDDEDVPPYSEWSYADLKQAVSTRGLDTPDNKRPTLEAALTADDEAVASDEATE